MLWLIFGIFFVLSLLAGSWLKNKFREYSAIPTANGMSGAEVARKMLYDYGCYDVNCILRVECVGCGDCRSRSRSCCSTRHGLRLVRLAVSTCSYPEY